MNLIQHNKLTTLINIIIGFFFLFILTIKGWYNYSPVLLIIISLAFYLYTYITKRPKQEILQDEKQLIITYLFYFSIFSLSFFIHNEHLRILDNPSRIIIFIPLLFLFRHFPIRFNIFIYYIPLGALIAGLTAIYDKFYLHSIAAYSPRIMHIQAGNIAMSLAMFSLVIGLYFITKKQFKMAIFTLISSLFGIFGSFLSTARGGWIGAPFIILFILWGFRKSLSKAMLISIISLITITIIASISIPETRITQRIKEAQNEVIEYFENRNGSTSVGARFDMWKSSILMAQEKPILGWGTQGAYKKQQEYAKQKIISEYAASFGHVHNQFLDVLSKRGLIGLISLIFVLFIPLIYFIKNSRNSIIEIKTISIIGIIHCLSVIFYCLSQGFLSHNSGNIFYFFLVVIFYGLLYSLQITQASTKIK